MELTNRYKRVPLSQIKVNRDDRQRRDVEIDEGFLESIKTRGVLQPILLNRELELVFGERRLTASRMAGHADIPCRFIEDLTPDEAHLLELEENLRRKELAWRDEVRAISKLHSLYLGKESDWARQDTVRVTGLTLSQVEIALRIHKDLDSPKIADATTARTAYNILCRIDERASQDAVSDILDAVTDMFGKRATNGGPGPTRNPTPGPDGPATGHGGGPAPHPIGDNTGPGPVAKPAFPQSIFNTDFIKWARAYEGQRFNFIHCDFPYGKELFAGPQSGRDKWTTYLDSKDVYEELIVALCENLDDLMSHSGHLMFWLSADIQIQAATLEMFRKLAPSLSFWPKPLIWHKTDNVGVLADPTRTPRHVYETALVASREDRLIIRAVSDTYGAPTDKLHHPSTKPEPVLRHFFSMFVDENTRMLDPTCGSGSSLRAAESLDADQVIGIESDPEHYASAVSALRSFRTLRNIAK